MTQKPRTATARKSPGRKAAVPQPQPQARQKADISLGWAPQYDVRALILLSAALLIARLFYMAFFTPYGLSPDEAQYWHWLSHNSLSFLTKPPLTTWLMGLSTAVLGNTLVGVKFFALLGQLAMPVLGFLIAREVAGRAAAWWAFALLTTVPLAAAGGLIMSPDALLVPLWLAALYSVVRALNTPTDARALCWPRWVIIGVLVGLAGLAKYSAAFFYPLLFAYLLASKRGWDWLMRPQIWVSGLIALAFQLPVLVWNVQNGWVGVSHVLWQTDGGGDVRHGGLTTLLEFLGSQAGVLGPIVFVLLLAAWAGSLNALNKNSKDQRLKLLLIFTLPLFVAFAGMTFHAKVQANWPVLATVPALVLLAVWLARQKRVVLYVALAGVALNGLLSVFLMDVPFFRAAGLIPISAKMDPTKDLQGWPQLGTLLGITLRAVNDPVLITSRYQTTAPLAFHVPGNPQVLYFNAENRRLNQYDLWTWPDLTNRVAVYVSERPTLPEGLNRKFESCAPWHALAVESHEVVTRRISTWLCWGYKKGF